MGKFSSDVIVVGGGVAGLAAAAAAARQGLSVTLLEARGRLGGRIFTDHRPEWRGPVEMGAEFVHEGNAALWRLLRKHHLKSQRVPESHWFFDGRKIAKVDDLARRIGRVTRRIAPRRMRGWSFADFLRRQDDLSPADRTLVADFVRSFQAAPTGKMSAAAMDGETLDTTEQYTLPRGYDALVAALADDARRAGVGVVLRAPVRRIEWRRGRATLRANRRIFTASAVVVALPLGVLQARPPRRGAIKFEPALGEKEKIISRMEVGHVIRLTLRFDARQWPVIVPAELQRAGGFGFVHSGVDGVPTWWALSPAHVVTGWAGGPAAVKLIRKSERGIREKALSSLSRIFGTPKPVLHRALADFATHNWSRDPFSRGAYSFIAAGQENASAKLRAPIEDTLFFAGEATADEAEIGTVHGALTSGLRAAEEVTRAVRRRA